MNLRSRGGLVKPRFLGMVAVLGACSLLLSACISATGVPALDREAKDSDRWPGDQASLEDTDMDVSTSRLLVSHGGLDYYVITSADQQPACLSTFEHVAGQEYDDGGCGGLSGGLIVQVQTPRSKMAFVRNDAEISDYESEAWERIHENIYIGKS